MKLQSRENDPIKVRASKFERWSTESRWKWKLWNQIDTAKLKWFNLFKPFNTNAEVLLNWDESSMI